MGKHKQGVCPGCSRHCPLSHVHCKYGEKYVQRLHTAQAAAPEAAKKTGEKTECFKWEKYVPKGSAAWKLLLTSRRLKRALRKGKVTAQQIHLALSDEEQAQLHTLLDKISRILE